MPVQKICTVIPKPEDQAEYKRLKAVLKLENQEFVKLCLLTNSPVYDWFAGRAISPQTEAKILHAIKELQKREVKQAGKPVVKPVASLDVRQIDEPYKQADPEPQVETKSNTPKWYTPIEVLDRLTASMQSAEQRLAVLEHETNSLATSRELEGEQADLLGDRVTNLEQRLEQIEEDEPEITGELWQVTTTPTHVPGTIIITSVWDLAAETENAALKLLSVDPEGSILNAIFKRVAIARGPK